MENTAKEFGKLTLFYSNDKLDVTLTYLEEELANLFEFFLRRIQELCLENDVSSVVYSDFGLLSEINDAICRAKQNGIKNHVEIGAFKQLLRDIYNNF